MLKSQSSSYGGLIAADKRKRKTSLPFLSIPCTTHALFAQTSNASIASDPVARRKRLRSSAPSPHRFLPPFSWAHPMLLSPTARISISKGPPASWAPELISRGREMSLRLFFFWTTLFALPADRVRSRSHVATETRSG